MASIHSSVDQGKPRFSTFTAMTQESNCGELFCSAQVTKPPLTTTNTAERNYTSRVQPMQTFEDMYMLTTVFFTCA